MDTKFSAGGDGSHPGKHGIAAKTGCSKTACSAALLTCFRGNFDIVFISVAYTDLRGYLLCPWCMEHACMVPRYNGISYSRATQLVTELKF